MLIFKTLLQPFFVFLFFSLSFFVLSSSVNAVEVFFADNFDDGNADGWQVVRNMQWQNQLIPCKNGALPASWNVVNNMLGIRINGPGCVTEIVPDDSLWNHNWKFYSIDVDMKFVAGFDKNIAWRYTDGSHWYGIHFLGNTGFEYQLQPPGGTGIWHSNFSLSNGNTYHLRIEVLPGNFKTFVNGVLKLDYYFDQNNDAFQSGKLALQASVGAVTLSEVYFDNIVVTSLEEEEGLPVPYFGQNDEEWASDTYDSLDATIGEVGCALSSAAMVLSYYGINQLPDGSPLDVGSLNQWLNENPDGSWRHGMTSWPALSRLSRLMHEMDESYPILDYRKIKPPDFGEIDQILTVEEDPLIFEEIKPLSPSGVHFTTATGMNTSGSDYFLLDPLDQSRNHFLIPPDQLVSARYLFPTATNLSYLILHADLGLNGLLTNPNDSRLGRNETGEKFNEILQADFSPQYPLLHDDDQAQTTGEVFWEYSIPDPVSGDYQLILNSDESGWYEFELYAYDRDANPMVFKKKVYVDADYPALYNLSYSQSGGEDFAVLTKAVDFSTLRNDVQALWDSEDISHEWTIESLLQMLRQAERYYPNNLERVRHFLNLFERQLHNHYPEYITDQGYEFLLEELGWLRDSL